MNLGKVFIFMQVSRKSLLRSLRLVCKIKVITLFIFGVLINTVSGCKEPNISFLFVENQTNIPLDFTAYFRSDAGQSQPLTFRLQPQQREGWRYIADSPDRGAGDRSFYKLKVSSAECVRDFDRAQIEEYLRRNGERILAVKPKMLSC